MSFLESVKSFFNLTPEATPQIKQQANDIGGIIAPIFREIPPDSKQGKFLTEGLRSWAYIAITAIADEISTAELQLFNRKGKDWILIDEHQALDLLEKPNTFQTKEEFLWLTSVYLLSEGEAPWYLDSAKNPTQMVLLNPYNLTLVYDTNNIIGSYKYRQSNGVQKEIPKEQIVFLKLPNFATPFRGMGVMKYIAQTLDIDNFIEEYLKLFFYNDTTPGAVLQTPNELNSDIIKRLKMQFQNRHQGVKNSHRLAVLEKGLVYTKISSNINELQLKELNDMIRDKVLAAFKVPKSVLGIVEDVNRANAEASSYSFAKRAVLPKMRLIEGQLNQFLLPKFSEKGLWFEFENPVEEDKTAQAAYWVQAISAGWLTANEVREEIGLDPLEEEDVSMDNPDNVPDDNNQDDNPNENPKKDRKRISKKTKESKSAFVEMMKDILESEKPTIRKEYNREELIKYHDDKIFFMNVLEADFKRDLKRNFKRQKKHILNQMTGKSFTKGNSINLTLDEENEISMMIKIASPHMLEAVLQEGKLADALLGLDGTLSSQDKIVQTFLKKRTLKLGKGTSKTTQNAIDNIVKEWADKGEDWTVLRGSIEEYFEGAEGAMARADTIARTELSKSTGFAQETVYKEAGAVSKKWLTAQDEMVCEGCAEMDGQIVGVEENYFDKGDSFVTSSGKEFDFGFDSVDNAELHPNCRCDIVPVFEGEKSTKETFRRRIAERVVKAHEEKIRLENLAKKEKELHRKEKKLEVDLKEVEEFKKELEI